jgi:hypothetical protein
MDVGCDLDSLGKYLDTAVVRSDSGAHGGDVEGGVIMNQSEKQSKIVA